MTIVAMGTSLPETSVSVTASLAGANDLSISNAVGSNIFNLLVVAGVCALFHPLPVHPDSIKRDFPFSIIAAAILLAFGFSQIISHASPEQFFLQYLLSSSTQ